MNSENTKKKFENYDKIVESNFDQFLQAVAKNKFYKHYIDSTQTREKLAPCKIVNANHVYCLYCNENYYTYSDFNDIKSFFQKHINTNYHKSSILISSLKKKTKIFDWEILGVSGHCNVCNISNLNAIVFDTGLTAEGLKKMHTCERKIRDLEKTYSNSEILKKFCSLPLFVEKFIIRDSNCVKCLLCSKILLGPKLNIEHHLVSEEHSIKFLNFVKKIFKFDLKDLLNGFHLEIILQWMLNNNTVFNNAEFEDCDEVKICLKESNDTSPLYNNKNYIQFVPKVVQELLAINSNDFILHNACFLCLEMNINASHNKSTDHLNNLTMANNILEKNKYLCNTYVNQCRERLLPFESDIQNYFFYQTQLQLISNVAPQTILNLHNNSAISEIKLETCVRCLLPFTKEKNVNCCNKCYHLMVDESMIYNYLFKTNNSSYIENFKCDANNKISNCESKIKPSSNTENLITNINKLQFEKSPLMEKSEIPKPTKKENSVVPTEKNNSKQLSKEAIQGNKGKICTNMNQKNSVPSKFKNCQSSKNKKKKNKSKQEEILVISNVPMNLLADDLLLYKLFRQYGKIKEIRIKKEKGIVVFENSEIAKAVANKNFILFENEKIQLSHKKAVLEKETSSQLDENIEYYFSEPEKFMDLILRLIKYCSNPSLVEEALKKEEIICNKIVNAVKNRFPNSRCYPFGSRFAGVYNESSDLDVFLDWGEMYEEPKTVPRNLLEDVIKETKSLLKSSKYFKAIIAILEAKIPILTFIDKETGLKCDLSFKNGMGVQKSLMLRFVISLDWRIKPLVLFLKYWRFCNGVNEWSFNSYTLILMLIFYLEQLPLPILPPIDFLQNNFVGRRITINGWDSNISRDTSIVPKTKNTDPLITLLEGFFEYYANFNYKDYIVSPLTGKLLLRSGFKDIQTLPMSYKRHFHNIPESDLMKNINSPVWVIDPFVLSQNTTANCPPKHLNAFIDLCKSSLTALMKSRPKLKV